MIRVVFKPVKAPVVNHEGLYGAVFNGHELFRVRARNAAHAERKLLFLMERETSGKTLDFDLEQQLKKDKDNAKEEQDAGD